MFDLEQAITRWRCRLAEGGITDPDLLAELECHLRDKFDSQIQLGLGEKRAFEAAVAAIGDPATLREEFEKIRGAGARSRRILRGFYFGSIVFVLLVNIWTLAIFDINLLERALGIATVSVIALCLAKLPYLLESLPSAFYVRLVKTIKLANSLVWLWAVWAILDAKHIVHVEIGILPTMILWCLCAAAGLSALAHGLSARGGPGRSSGGSSPPLEPCPMPTPPTRPSPVDLSVSRPFPQTFASISRDTLEMARAEASRLGHDFVGTEHVLLALLKLAQGTFVTLLQNLHLDRETVRLEIERAVCAGPFQEGKVTMPFTPRACRALRLAAREARKSNQPPVGAEHVLLGLLLEGNGVAGRVLRKLGIEVKRTRAEILCGLGTRRGH